MKFFKDIGEPVQMASAFSDIDQFFSNRSALFKDTVQTKSTSRSCNLIQYMLINKQKTSIIICFCFFKDFFKKSLLKTTYDDSLIN